MHRFGLSFKVKTPLKLTILFVGKYETRIARLIGLINECVVGLLKQYVRGLCSCGH